MTGSSSLPGGAAAETAPDGASAGVEAAAVTTGAPQAPRPKAASPGNTWGLLLIIFGVVVTGALAFPTFIILACGMPPALAAALIDNKPGRHASYCVISANLAGVAMVLSTLWAGGNSVAYAMLLLSDVYVWLGMYSAAAIGWALIWLFSFLAEFVLAFMANQRVRGLFATQKSMVEEWGKGVTGREESL